MSVLVVSDLHLGARSEVDLLRREDVRERFVAALEEADELVLLGDVLELREAPLGEALEAARPFLQRLGQAFAGRRIVMTPGNHDHQLLEGWRERRRALDDAPLGLSQLVTPAEASHGAARMAELLEPARLELAYPGLRVRDDVYATHGHYLDRHVTVPALEPLAIRAAERVLRARGAPLDGVDGYEAVLGPVYALAGGMASTGPSRTERRPPGPNVSERAFRMLSADRRGSRPLRDRVASRVVFPAAVAALSAAGLGPLRAELSGRELRRAALLAMSEVVRGLGLRSGHVVFGHTHRTGPLPGDDPIEWRTAEGVHLHNAGSWVIERYVGGPFPQRGPYRAGAGLVVEDEGPPRVAHFLDDLAYAEAG